MEKCAELEFRTKTLGKNVIIVKGRGGCEVAFGGEDRGVTDVH